MDDEESQNGNKIESQMENATEDSTSTVTDLLHNVSSDHDFKTELMKYYIKAQKILDEDRLWDDLSESIIGISPNQLFNLLNQETSKNYPKLSDTNYLLIIDTRSAEEYNNGHIITSRRISYRDGSFVPLYGWDLEYKQNIVIYDTFSLAADTTSRVYQCAKLLRKAGCRYPIRILDGGYAEFCKHYPDFNTITISYTARELDTLPTYPNEILLHQLYLGRPCHAHAEFVRKQLKLKAIVTCGKTQTEMTDLSDTQLKIFHVPVPEYGSDDIMSHFALAANFIENNLTANQPVLVCSTTGNSASAVIAMAYLMQCRHLNLQKAYFKVRECRTSITPSLQYMKQLSEFELAISPNLINPVDVEKLIR